MNTRIPMTSQGVEKLKKELLHLKNVRRPEIIRSIVAAREYGDLKENSEYHAAKEQQEFCERRILEIEKKLLYAQVIDIKNFSPSKKVIFGTTVVIINIQTKKKQTYRIVGEDEADFKKNLISVKSPIARGLIGKKQGDIVTVVTPNGDIKYKILQVKYL